MPTLQDMLERELGDLVDYCFECGGRVGKIVDRIRKSLDELQKLLTMGKEGEENGKTA